MIRERHVLEPALRHVAIERRPAAVATLKGNQPPHRAMKWRARHRTPPSFQTATRSAPSSCRRCPGNRRCCIQMPSRSVRCRESSRTNRPAGALPCLDQPAARVARWMRSSGRPDFASAIRLIAVSHTGERHGWMRKSCGSSTKSPAKSPLGRLDVTRAGRGDSAAPSAMMRHGASPGKQWRARRCLRPFGSRSSARFPGAPRRPTGRNRADAATSANHRCADEENSPGEEHARLPPRERESRLCSDPTGYSRAIEFRQGKTRVGL